MRIIGKSENTVVGDIINTKDVYYCKLNENYTAFKFKELNVKFITNDRLDKYDTSIELTILTAVDNKEHKIPLDCFFSYYRTKDDVKNGKESKILAFNINEKVFKIVKDFGMFKCWKWDSVKAIEASWNIKPPHELVGVHLATYDLLTDTLVSPTDVILRFCEKSGEQPIYFLRCDCESENVIKIYDFE